MPLTGIDKVEVGSFGCSSSKAGEPLSVAVEPIRTDEKVQLEKAVGVRRVFSYAQFFAFSLAYMGVWEGVCV